MVLGRNSQEAGGMLRGKVRQKEAAAAAALRVHVTVKDQVDELWRARCAVQIVSILRQ